MAQKMSKGLEGIVAAETGISFTDGQEGRLVYRGCSAKELAVHHGFEEVSCLLWYGKLPDEKELASLKQQFRKARALPEYIEKLIRELPKGLSMMSVLRTCLSAMENESSQWPPAVEEAVRLTAAVPVIIASRLHAVNGRKRVAPHEELDHTANYLYMLKGKEAPSAHVKALEAYFILTMEHGMNASTFASRVIASSESDMVSAVTGAIGAMKGPLHGGAPTGVTAMLNEVGSKEKAEAWIRQQLEDEQKLMGFGHRIYKTKDPRAEALKEVAQQLTDQDPWLDLAVYLEETAIRLLGEYKPGRGLYTNVEFYAAAILRAVDLPDELFTPTFTAARTASWTAHILEQSADNRIYRPQSHYTGELPS